MDLIERVKQNEYLGREFLTWLWFRSETGEGFFDLGEGETVEIFFDGKTTLQREEDEGMETVTCAGENPSMTEARFALIKGKQVTQTRLRLISGDDEWSLTMDSSWFNFRSVKTPKVIQGKGEDADGFFYEKTALIEKPVHLMNALFATFLDLRISPEWSSEEAPAITQWIQEGA